jgi:hypothetical protein
MKIELYIAIMAGFVLSAFVMVSEVVFLRKRFVKIRKRLIHYYLARRYFSFFGGICAMILFFLVQPLIVSYLIMLVLDTVNPHFSTSVFSQVRQVLFNSD